MAFSPPGSFSPRGPRGRKPFSKDEHRINERIRVPEVRLIGAKGEQVGIVPTREALQLAKDAGLDLMEVAPNARPPVCKILDYGKFKYEKKKKDQQAKKNQVVVKVKEVQLRPGTETHDLDYKFKNVRTFLEAGDKAKITMLFRGREITHTEVGMKLMKQLIEATQDVGVVEAKPRMDGRKMIMVLAPQNTKAAQKGTKAKKAENKSKDGKTPEKK